MKKLISLTLIVCSLTLFGTYAHASSPDDVTVVLDGETLNFDVPPQIINGRTMVPMRAIFEKLGATVNWNPEVQLITATNYGIFISMEINRTKIFVNTLPQELDVPPLIINNRTLVPLRAVSNCMGATVDWDSATRTVYITSPQKIKYIDWDEEQHYYGETKNDKADGFGILYFDESGDISQIGRFEDGHIVQGTTYYPDGDVYTGTYDKEGPLFGGIYFANGDYYGGGIPSNTRSPHGTYEFSNGDLLSGNFDILGGCQNGIYYSAEYDMYCKGYFYELEPHGVVNFLDSASNYLYSAEYHYGELIREYYPQ